ncbi:MAG: hypothetical protein RLZZ328_533 [Bacteroidota bacterium]|jgi:hypothetical protein
MCIWLKLCIKMNKKIEYSCKKLKIDLFLRLKPQNPTHEKI